MSRLRQEQGTGLILFATLLGITLSLVLVLSAVLNHYFYARNLTDYLEQLTVATLTVWNQDAEAILQAREIAQKFPSSFENFRLISAEILPGPTLHISGCVRWRSPIPLIEVSTEICRSALAR